MSAQARLAAARARQRRATKKREEMEIKADMMTATRNGTQPGMVIRSYKDKEVIFTSGLEEHGTTPCPHCRERWVTVDVRIYRVESGRGYADEGRWCGFCPSCAKRQGQLLLQPLAHWGIEINEFAE